MSNNSIEYQIEQIPKVVLNEQGIDKLIFVQNPGFEARLTVRYLNKSMHIIDVYPEMVQFINDLKPKENA